MVVLQEGLACGCTRGGADVVALQVGLAVVVLTGHSAWSVATPERFGSCNLPGLKVWVVQPAWL